MVKYGVDWYYVVHYISFFYEAASSNTVAMGDCTDNVHTVIFVYSVLTTINTEKHFFRI